MEQKATTLLSVLVVAAPLTASTAVFVRRQSLPPWAGTFTLIAALAAAAFGLLAFVAVLRALAVRAHDALYVETVIDPMTNAVRLSGAHDGYASYHDFYGRGLLWEAMSRHAVCDHLADFVRAAQVFIALNVILTLAAAFPVLPVVRGDPQRVAGTISLDSSTVQSLRAPIDAALLDNAGRMDRIERALDSLRTQTIDPDLTQELATLQSEVAGLRERLASKGR